MQLLLVDFGKRKGRLLSLSLHLYFTLNEVGCLGLVLPLLLNSLRQPDCFPKLSIKLSSYQSKNRQRKLLSC
jgi:hypothetical protein